MDAAKAIDTPIGAQFKLSYDLSPKIEEMQDMSNVPYTNSIGSIMYAMVCTRPDIAHSGTADSGLIYQRKQTTIGLVEGYVDSDYTKDLDERRSITGYLFTGCGCVVSWKSTLQNIVALSTTKVEYATAVEATKEALWLKGLNQGFDKRTKHIDVRFHFIRDTVEQGLVNVSKISTADMLTKPILKVKFKQCLNLINVGAV
ncbi:Retrovirus-related Pol polyprotein from transposon TNT 1-94 [Vitis vinifera]|uniref:Retrovirus-related Pol polyprotein from transposon TNT 1-94 n=1 Tax=Vitis vinifera TaxID=29760 RepID=A0A438H0B1_VITVI|nr:Retrovirus-related Pol polyprotein from transposon TNT 1-94 [Vitis vinifera]